MLMLMLAVTDPFVKILMKISVTWVLDPMQEQVSLLG